MTRVVKVVLAAGALQVAVVLVNAATAAIGAEMHWLVAVTTVGAWLAALTALGLVVSAARQGGEVR